MVIDFYRYDLDVNYRPRFFVYDMIETLLPNSSYSAASGIKLLEM